MELDFGKNGVNGNNAEKLANFLDKNASGDWGPENETILRNRAVDKLKDLTNSMNVTKNIFTKAVETAVGKFGLSNVVEDAIVKISNVNRFTSQLMNQGAEIGKLQIKFGITDKDKEILEAMPDGIEKEKARLKFNENIKKYNAQNKNFEYNQLITDQNTPLSQLNFKKIGREKKWGKNRKKTGKRILKDGKEFDEYTNTESPVGRFKFPSGVKIDIDFSDLQGYGLKGQGYGQDEIIGNDAKFNNNIALLGLTQGNIDYIEDIAIVTGKP